MIHSVFLLKFRILVSIKVYARSTVGRSSQDFAPLVDGLPRSVEGSTCLTKVTKNGHKLTTGSFLHLKIKSPKSPKLCLQNFQNYASKTSKIYQFHSISTAMSVTRLLRDLHKTHPKSGAKMRYAAMPSTECHAHKVIRNRHLQGVTSELDMAIPWVNVMKCHIPSFQPPPKKEKPKHSSKNKHPKL